MLSLLTCDAQSQKQPLDVPTKNTYEPNNPTIVHRDIQTVFCYSTILDDHPVGNIKLQKLNKNHYNQMPNELKEGYGSTLCHFVESYKNAARFVENVQLFRAF
jgi:hypothetical protein